MEKKLYRENLEIVMNRFGEAQLIPIVDVAKFLGIHPETLKQRKGFPKKQVARRFYVTQSALADWMSDLERS